MLLLKPSHCLMLAGLLMLAGCNNDNTSSDVTELAVDAGVSTQPPDNESPPPAEGSPGIESTDNDTPAAASSESEQLSESDTPSETSDDSEQLSEETIDESDTLEDDALLTPPTDTTSVHTFELSVDEDRVLLDEGDSEGATVVIEVSPDGDERIDLMVDPQTSSDGQGIEIALSRPSLDSENPSTTVSFTMPVGMQPQLDDQRTFVISATSGEEVEIETVTLDISPLSAPDVYLLIGQSNMVGSSEEGARQITPGGADEQNSRIWQLNVTHNDVNLFARPADFVSVDRLAVEPRFVQAQDPLHEPLRVSSDEKGGTKVGSGMSFARAALSDTTQPIYLVPAAWGASGFCDVLDDELAWNAEASSNTALGGTGLLDRAIARLNLTLQNTDGVFRGILWHQGEADSGRSACAESYAQNLALMVERIRAEASEDARGESARGREAPIPFIVGTMSKGEDSRGDFSRWSEAKEQVDAVHRQVADLIPYADWVNNDDLVPSAYPCGSGSCVHFGSLAIREMGQRYYQALERVWER